MDNQGSTFTYQPLRLDGESREFRLLRLLPSTDPNSEIFCELFNSNLDSAPAYEAISYVWGDPAVTVPIQACLYRQNVTRSLGTVLCHLRLENRERILWADALCINQNDIQEKNHQVKQMRSVYLRAKMVILWLGEEGNAQLAVDFCRFLERGDWDMEELLEKMTDANMDACHDLFFRRPYWKRQWTIQEILHSETVLVHIGKIQISFEELNGWYGWYGMANTIRQGFTPEELRSYKGMLRISRLSQSTINYISGQRAQSQEEKEDQPFGLLLSLFRNQEASDPRDKIFSLVGMTDEIIVPDYNLSEHHVYKHATQTLIFDNLEVLLLVESLQRPVSSSPELPSWVPDLSNKQSAVARTMAITSHNFSADQGFHAIIPACRSLVNPLDPFVTLEGIYVGVVTGVCTIQVNLNFDNDDTDDFKLMRYERDPAKRSGFIADPWQVQGGSGSEATFLNTSWAPHWAEIGDTIIVAAGSRIPLVVRKDGDSYLLVGGCWLIESELGAEPDLSSDPGFSDIMRGSVHEEVGVTREIEDFRLH